MHRYVESAGLIVLFAIVTVCAVGSARGADETAYEPTASYERREIHGFDVRISQRVKEYPGPAEAALKLLAEKLEEVNTRVPAEALGKMKKTSIWVEWELAKNSAACAHHSHQWLKDNGRNPDKAGTVEISNLKLFLAWTPKTQPMMVLHELAHYYHIHQASAEQRKAVTAAFSKARKSGLYESVDYTLGGKRRAYALSNESEYFAELSEAWFGRNDFYPFTRDELQKFDSQGTEAMKLLWGN